MKKILFIPFIVLIISMQGCSWICRFYIANTTNETVTIDIKLSDYPGNFPVFHYPFYHSSKVHLFKLKNNHVVIFESVSEFSVDTLDKFSHYNVQIPPHTAIEIGQLQNDHYKSYDQYFINGRIFNLEKLSIFQKNIEIVPSTFDNYFHSEKQNEVYFVL